VIKITARIAAVRFRLNVQRTEIEGLRRCSDDGDPAACESTNRHRNRKVRLDHHHAKAHSCCELPPFSGETRKADEASDRERVKDPCLTTYCEFDPAKNRPSFVGIRKDVFAA
jgi:hypothetical protein